jgi:hypothetical protein
VSYCNFKNKPIASEIGNLIHTALSPGVPGYSRIRYNSFQDMPGAGGDNGNECIRLENGAQSTYVGRTVVEFNYFNNTGPGDSEVISVKCRENVLRYNTFTNNQDGMMCFRNGDSNIAYGNFFINAGGIRVKEANDTYCYNNYFEKSGSSGSMGSVLYVYDTSVTTNVLKNINFFHNTFVNCGTIDLDTGATAHTWANNIFSNTSGNIFKGSTSGIKWAGNQYSGTPGITIPSGMTKTNSLLVRNSTGYYVPASNSPAIDKASTNYPAILDIANVDDDPSLLLDISGLSRPADKILKDVGCSEYTNGAAFNHPLALSDVGPSYLGGPGGANVAPSVTLTAPTNSASFTAPASITMTATASDTDGTVTNVSFYNGSTLLGSDTNSPYAYTWTNVASGSYNLTARAWDNSNAVSTSAVAAITVLDPTYTLTVNSGSGGGSYTNGHQVAISANAVSGKAFVQWTGDTQYVNNVTYTNAVVTMSTNAVSLTATYVDVYYALTVNSGSGDGSYTNGTKVQVSADAPAAGKAFSQWTGDTAYVANSNSASSTVTMPAQAVTLTATYIDVYYALTVNSGTGDGSYTNGTQVAIAASNLTGKAFSQWIGDTQYVNNVTYTNALVTMPVQAVALTATYVDVLYTLTVTGGSGSGSSYTNTQVVEISADAPATGMTFDKWTGDTQYVAGVSSSNTTVTMPAQAVALSSTYKILPGYYTLTVSNGTGGGIYSNGVQVTVTAVAPEGKAFAQWIGDTQIVAGVFSLNTIVTMPAQDAALTAACVDATNGVANVNWAASAGFYFSADSGTGILGPNGSGKATIAQLMYSPDNTKDSILSSRAGSVNDVVWDTMTITENGDGITEWAVFADSTVRAFTNGYVYTLIFQDNNVQAGDWYYSTPLLALEQTATNAAPQSIEMNTDTVYGDAIDGPNGAQVVEETVTYTLTVNSGAGGGSYTNSQQVTIAANAISGKTFAVWTGDTQYVDNASSLNTTVTMPAQAVALTATYVDTTYALTVNSGTGGGSYTNGQQVAIAANAISGQVFDQWTGATQVVNNVTYTNALVTMSTNAVTLTATYSNLYYTLTATAGAGGTVSPTNAIVLSGDSTNFVITANNYYRIATLTTNGTAVTGMSFDNNSTATNFIWSNVQTSGVLSATFTAQVTTNTPAPVPYSWLAQYGLTNWFPEPPPSDSDGDGLKDWEEYIAGTVPTNAASVLKAAQTVRNVVTWTPQSNRIYSVYWSTNLVKGFTNLNNNILYPTNSFTNATPDSRVNHYQIKVRMQ